jgi:hypothetical protein
MEIPRRPQTKFDTLMAVECLRMGNDEVGRVGYLSKLDLMQPGKPQDQASIVLVVLKLDMFRNRFMRPIVVFLALASPSCLLARGHFWDFLGYTRVDGTQDHGRIQIVRHDRLFRTIQVRVSGESIFFDRLVLHFGNGTSQGFVVSGRIPAQGENYVIDLPGEVRLLESVELWYYKEPWGHNPTVSLYGIPLPESAGQSMARVP